MNSEARSPASSDECPRCLGGGEIIIACPMCRATGEMAPPTGALPASLLGPKERDMLGGAAWLALIAKAADADGRDWCDLATWRLREVVEDVDALTSERDEARRGWQESGKALADSLLERAALAARLAAAEAVVAAARWLVAEVVPDTPFAGLESVDALKRRLDVFDAAAPGDGPGGEG